MKGFFRDNGGLLVVAAVLLAALLAIVSAITGVNPITSAVRILTNPVGAATAGISDWLQGQKDRLTAYDDLLEENEKLKEQLAEMEEQVRESQDAVRENERLQQLLGVAQEHPDWAYASATVTQRSVTNWGNQITLNAGSNEDVAVGDCVIDQYGNLVGVVEDAGSTWCLVSTVLDPGLELGVRVSRTDDSGMAQGDFSLMGAGKLKLTYIPQNAQLVTGDQVTTSGLGDKYPGGLMVGKIESIQTEADGISRTGVLLPSADVANIRYVYVITNFEG